MAAVAPKSSLITAFETRGTAAPSMLSPLTYGGKLRSIIAVTDVAAADSDADTFQVMPVFSSWRLAHIFTKTDAITSGTAYELGLNSVTAAFVTAVIDADCYAATQTMATAITALPIDLKNKTLDIALNAQAVWQNPTGGPATDPQAFYYLALTATTVGSAAGQIVMDVHYVEPNG